MMRIFFFLLCLFTGSVHAAWTKETGWKLEQGADGIWTVFPDRGNPGSQTTTCTTTACTRGGSILGPLGRPPPNLSPTTPLTKGAIAAGALALGARALPWLSVGAGLYDWWKSAGLTPDAQGAPQVTVGGQNTVSGYYYYAAGSTDSVAWGKFADSGSVATKIKSVIEQQQLAVGYRVEWVASPAYNVTAPGCVVGQGSYNRRNIANNSLQTGYCTGYQVDRAVLSQTACADSAGVIQGYATGGKCPQGTLTPLSIADAQVKLQDAPITADVLRRALQDALDGGASIEHGPLGITGPSTAPGPTRTDVKTTATGTTAVTTINTTYNYTYNNSNITITQTDKVTNPDGTTQEQTTNEPQVDKCKKNPTALECADLTNKETGTPEWQTKTVTYQADTLGMPAACPAPWTGVVHGWNLSMSWQPACDVAPGIRAGVLALAALSALLLIITTIRQ